MNEKNVLLGVPSESPTTRRPVLARTYMVILTIIAVSFLLPSKHNVREDDNNLSPTVKLDDGVFTGVAQNGYDKFLGIRFAQPP
jgi:hypothetical protein